MNLENNLSTYALFCALIFSAFSANLFAQPSQTEKNGSITDYERVRFEDAGIIRKRTVESEKSGVKPSENQIAELEKQAFLLSNQKRSENGLSPIEWSDEVAKVARHHSENMVKFNFFAHRGMDGKNVDGRADSFGLTKWTLIGENIAYNRGYKNPVETAVEKWMLSPSHRENLLNDRWKESAVGIAVTDDGTYYFTQVFIKRR